MWIDCSSLKGKSSAIEIDCTDVVKERKDYDVDIITYTEFWDSHGTRVPRGGVKQILGRNKLTFERVETTLNEIDYTYENWRWYVNGKQKKSEVYELDVKGNKARLAVCIGHG